MLDLGNIMADKSMVRRKGVRKKTTTEQNLLPSSIILINLLDEWCFNVFIEHKYNEALIHVH